MDSNPVISMYHTYMAPILVTGSSGNIGRLVTEQLQASGAQVRTADLDTGFNFTDSTTWAVFEGIEVMFLMRPPALSNIKRDMVPSLEAARRAGVKHMVLLSLQGAEQNKVVPHAKIEAWLRESGLAYTFIRPSFFMENLSTTHASDIRDHDQIIVPAGDGLTAFVAAHDVAAVSTAALLHPDEHRNKAWTPTGPAALSYYDVADILSEVLGRRIEYTKPGLIRYFAHAVRTLDMPLPMAAVTSAIYTVARLGKAGGLTHDVEEVTGEVPLSLAQWAPEHKDRWQ